MRHSLAQRIVRTFLATLLLCVAGCGGSGGGTNYAGGGIGGTGVSIGAITALGSIDVNGVEFNTRDAVVIVGGVNVGAGDAVVGQYLAVGKVVVVEGTTDSNGMSGTASQVRFDADVLGPVEHIDIGAKEIVVLGQRVVIDDTTLFVETTLETLAVDEWVEISGLPGLDGTIRATYVGKKDPGTIVEVKGPVRNLNPSAYKFEIGDLGVRYGEAALPDGEPVEEELVQVTGGFPLEPDGSLRAGTVRVASEASFTDVDTMEVEGFVTDFLSSSEFHVGYQDVRTNGKTKVQGGSEQDLMLGVKLRVRGSLVNRVLLAEKIFFR
jgi:hypothetical protein